MLGLSKKAVLKYAGIGTLIAVLGFFGWYFLSVLSERDDLLLDKQRLERSLDDCVEDQNKLISTLNEYEEEMEAIQRYSKRLEQRAKELEQDREEAQRELDQKMEELDQIEIGEKCEDNMEFLRQQAIERGEEMMKHTLVLILAMFISGCALFQSPEYERIEMPEKIHVPYYEVCPALELFETPQLPVDNIDELSSYEEISRAYVQSIALLEYRIETYEDMIRACKEWEPEEENDD